MSTTDKRTRGTLKPGRLGLAAVCAVIGLASSPAVAGAILTNFTWSGTAAVGESKWSNPVNWEGSAPSVAAGTLTFPALTSSQCTAKPPTWTCYTSNNDVSGLTVGELSIDDGVAYNITGEAITLLNGIKAAPSVNDPPCCGSITVPELRIPLTLGAPQTWSIAGGSNNQQLGIDANVTGSLEPLTISLSSNTFLGIYADAEVGAVTVTGSGTIALGSPGTAGSLDATDGGAVSFASGAGLYAQDASIGPVTMTGGGLQVGSTGISSTLSVAGGVTLDATSTATMFINKLGTTAGSDYSQLSATGAVNLGSSKLNLTGMGFPEGGGSGYCPTLKVGDVDTLITTTGTLEGTFSNAANGATVEDSCQGLPGTAPTVRINYTEHTVTATVVTAGSSGTPTTTTLSPSPASPVTNQVVTLTVTVAANSGTPSGTVTFYNDSNFNLTPITGCTSQPVTLSGSSYTATCQTSFTAASSPVPLVAIFSPANGSGLQGSQNSPLSLVIAKDSTTTALGVSSLAPAAGASVTYTATVTPGHPGATRVSGSVEFLDNGAPIGSCASQSLTPGASSSSATCTLSYTTPGTHTITATYTGDPNFAGSSSSPAQTVTVTGTTPAATCPTGQTGTPPNCNTSAPPTKGTTSSGSTPVGSATKPLTRAQKLAKALAACHKLKKRKRAKCIAAAKKRYSSHKTHNKPKKHRH